MMLPPDETVLDQIKLQILSRETERNNRVATVEIANEMLSRVMSKESIFQQFCPWKNFESRNQPFSALQ